jgi:tetratricopeptide (TPR) repeat protein
MSHSSLKGKILYSKAVTSYSQGTLKEATILLTHYLAKFGDNVNALKILGICHFDQGAYAQAAQAFSKVIKIIPADIDAVFNLSICHSKNQDWQKAISAYLICVDLDAVHWQAFSGLGDAYMATNYINEALHSYVKAINIRGLDDENLLFKISQALLVNGAWEEGFELFEHRTSLDTAHREHINIVRWQGQPLSGKNLLIECEQGFGDSIQFSRYFNLLHNMGAILTVACPEPLIDLFAHSFPNDNFLLPNSVIESKNIDFYVPIMSLPGLLQCRPDNVPSIKRYCSTPPLYNAKWLWLNKITKLKVGIVWGGNQNHKNDKNRSIAFDEIFKFLPSNIQYFSIQKNDDLLQLNGQENLTILSKEITNFADTAAICENLDLVVTVDTSIAHLCGALGVKTWLMLPFSPDWRWLLNRNDSVWYESIEIFRQLAIGDWESVLKQINYRLLLILRS